MEERGRSIPPFLELCAVARRAELGELSYPEAVRLLWLSQRAAALSPRAELVMLERLLEQDDTDLRFLRRLRDLKLDLGEPMQPAQEELALLLDPQNVRAAHLLANVLRAQGKPTSLLIEEMGLRETFREFPTM
jgi:hypothetical protein